MYDVSRVLKRANVYRLKAVYGKRFVLLLGLRPYKTCPPQENPIPVSRNAASNLIAEGIYDEYSVGPSI